MDKKTIIAGVGAALILAMGVFIGQLGQKQTQSTPQEVGGTGPVSAFNYDCVGGVCTYSVSQAISATSSVLCSFPNPTNAFQANGTATSTGATTTLLYASIRVDAGLASAQTLDIATSSSVVVGTYPNVTYAFFGSSTPAFVNNASVGTGKSDIIWQPFGTTTGANPARVLQSANLTGQSAYFVGPNEAVNFRLATSSAGVFSAYLSGQCEAVFRME